LSLGAYVAGIEAGNMEPTTADAAGVRVLSPVLRPTRPYVPEDADLAGATRRSQSPRLRRCQRMRLARHRRQGRSNLVDLALDLRGSGRPRGVGVTGIRAGDPVAEVPLDPRQRGISAPISCSGEW
jgi:hypothetical protein